MHLQRIQVPDFRVLKDVDITFEKEFPTRIFPLGSLNGGGKSTLLQLIFVLLHCSANPDRIVFLKNMINGFKVYKNSDKRVLATVEVWAEDKIVNLEFFSYKDSYIRELLSENGKDEVSDYNYIKFSSSKKSEEVNNRILRQEKVIRNIERSLERWERFKEIEIDEERNSLLMNEIGRLRAFGVKIPKITFKSYYFEEAQEAIQQELEIYQVSLKKLSDEHRQLEFISQKISNYLQSEKLMYICNYSGNEDEGEEEALLCRIDNIDMTKAESFLKELSQKVFLAAPATQVFLFVSKESRKLLFKEQSNENNEYYLRLQDAKTELPGFFAYDFFSVDLLIESCKDARDRDFREAIKTGEYGTSYKELMNELNSVLSNKTINLNIDISGVNFKLDRDGETIKLDPEDLSHGELKRLSIYLWIKYKNMENAIVLMDEIEIAFHPDWQYQIISDLQQWAPSNQYILATHSYELCQALTPSHVKELEPKLLKQKA